MELKNIRFTRAENLSKDLRDKNKLPDKGLIVIESLNPNLSENFIPIKEGGIREYLLSKGEFIEEAQTQ
jgi:hypothetical protein